ncbi:MAG: hypothetical protein HFG62_14035 [Lachnospiraceae bacterium]|nr:hypothetical protein [Lachnospiraceae bacterium]MCI8960221.1 hypothetical protein [Lachnospiraceae bacterium]
MKPGPGREPEQGTGEARARLWSRGREQMKPGPGKRSRGRAGKARG